MGARSPTPNRRVALGDLIDAHAVADIIGVHGPRAVSLYRSRYGDFPAPAIELGRGMLWVRADIMRWAKANNRRPQGGAT